MKKNIIYFVAVTAYVFASCSSEDMAVQKSAALTFDTESYIKVWKDANIQVSIEKEK